MPKRVKKINRLKGPIASKAKVFFCGVMPSATYGGEVTGFTPQEIRLLRRTAARVLGLPASSTKELGWQLFPKRDPLKLATSTFKRYCKEWWQASDEALKQGDGLDVGELSKSFNTTLTTLGQIPERASWLRKSTGPLSDMHLWMREAGWEHVHPGIFLGRDGFRYELTCFDPTFITDEHTSVLTGMQG